MLQGTHWLWYKLAHPLQKLCVKPALSSMSILVSSSFKIVVAFLTITLTYGLLRVVNCFTPPKPPACLTTDKALPYLSTAPRLIPPIITHLCFLTLSSILSLSRKHASMPVKLSSWMLVMKTKLEGLIHTTLRKNVASSY